MNSYHITFLKLNTIYLLQNATEISTLQKLGIKKLLVRKTKRGFTIKMKKQEPSKFIRIPMRSYSLKNVWYAQFPTNNDLILFKCYNLEGELRLKVFPHQWKYRFLLLNIIS